MTFTVSYALKVIHMDSGKSWAESPYKQSSSFVTKTCLYNFGPLTLLLYSKTGVYRGIRYFFFISAQNIDCGYSLEPPRRGGSNEYPQSMF